MKALVGLGALILLAGSPARAQVVGGGSALNSNNSMNALSPGPAVAFPSLPLIPATHFAMSVTSGSSATFVPSTFMAYDKAVAKGVVDLAAKPKSLVEAAHEYRNVERAKAQITFVQDEGGRVVRAPE